MLFLIWIIVVRTEVMVTGGRLIVPKLGLNKVRFAHADQSGESEYSVSAPTPRPFI